MSTYQSIKRLALLLLIGLSFGACNSWLDVTPSDSVTEEKLLSSKEGFHQALNGIYLDLNIDSLYGATLLCSDIEILAQRYSINNNNSDYTDLANYKYKTTYPKQVFQGTWTTAYNLILSTNKLLENADLKKDILGTEYDLFRGELLGLRAMLHFDLLRLFGPVLALHPNDKAIPYKTSGTLITSPILTAEEVIEKIMTDLKNAETALANDPIKTQGPNFGSNTDDFWSSRSMRLNYYAVKGLEARVALYAVPLKESYKNEAYEAATSIIKENESKNLFPFVDPTEIQGTKPDRIFSTEVLFMNQNVRRVNKIFQAFFDPSLSAEKILLPDNEALSNLYAETDYRYRPIWKSAPEKSGLCFYKYATVENGRSNDMIPMIRLSEMYLIAAETAATQEEAIQYLNTLSMQRGTGTVSAADDIESILTNEYRREFFGEGQLFFFYKRKNVSYIPILSDMPWDSQYVTPDVYVIPLPDSEIMYR